MVNAMSNVYGLKRLSYRNHYQHQEHMGLKSLLIVAQPNQSHGGFLKVNLVLIFEWQNLHLWFSDCFLHLCDGYGFGYGYDYNDHTWQRRAGVRSAPPPSPLVPHPSPTAKLKRSKLYCFDDVWWWFHLGHLIKINTIKIILFWWWFYLGHFIRPKRVWGFRGVDLPSIHLSEHF